MATCRDKLMEVLGFSRKCAAICGADVLDPNFQYTWLTWVVIICTFTFFILSGYTIYVGVYVQGDWTVILQALCMVGSAVAGITKLFSAIEHKNDFQQLFVNLDYVYRVYEQKHQGYQDVLYSTTSLTEKFLRMASLVYTVGLLTLLSVPIFFLVVHHEKLFVMQFLLPGIDPTTDSGHLMTISAHTVCITFGAFGNFAGDMFFFMLTLQVPMIKNILKVKFEDMNRIVLDASDQTCTLPLVLNVLKWHQDYTIYTKTVSDMYFVVTFVQIFTTTFSIAMTVFITITGDWPAGYAYLVYSVIILYTYCGLGTVTEIANDDVCDYVYNVCLWYEFPIAEQKMLMTMLVKAQKPTLLTVGDIMPLSVTTALSLTKSIYSFMMMLFNMAED